MKRISAASSLEFGASALHRGATYNGNNRFVFNATEIYGEVAAVHGGGELTKTNPYSNIIH